MSDDRREDQFGDRFQVETGALWLFGYGSLIFRPGFVAEQVVVAELQGYARRFWQGSPDHRGTGEAPGRVVTLVAAPGERCLGLAYRIDAASAERVLAELDRREAAGFSRLEVELTASSGARLSALTYVADHTNPHYLGPAPLGELARQIRSSRGPSGSNEEYVLRLAAALRELGAHDEHVFEIERALVGAS